MRHIRYKDFALQIDSDEQGSHRVRILSSPYPGGDAPFNMPFSPSEIPRVIMALERAVLESGPKSRRAHAREIGTAEDQRDFRAQTEQIGRALFDALFPEPVLASYLLSRGSVEALDDMGLRLRLIIAPDRSQLDSTCSLPWEFLYFAKRREFLARNPLTPIVRHFDVTQATHFPSLASGLRILVAMANPKQVETLDLAQERQWIETAWAHNSSAEVIFLEHATFTATYRLLRDQQFHILHFMGHGSINELNGEGALLFEDSDGNADVVPSDILADHFRSARSLRLLFLNACDSGTMPRHQGRDPYTGVASALVLRGFPAVVAMQFAISDGAAVAFSDGFYSALASGLQVDTAVAEGRLAILKAFPDSLSWITPVLYSCALDDTLFGQQIARWDAESWRHPLAAVDSGRPATHRALISLKDGSYGLADRQTEFLRLLTLSESNGAEKPHLEIWRTQPASGLSYFLRQASRLLREEIIILYADCASQVQNAAFSQLLVALFNHYAPLWQQFQMFFRAAGGRKASSALAGLPYLGSLLGSDSAHALPRLVETTSFASNVAELVCEFLQSVAQRHTVVVLLDNAQDMDTWSLDLLRTTIGRPYRRLRYIMAFVERDRQRMEHAMELVLQDLEASYRITHLDFPLPDSNFVMALAALHGITLSSADADGLAIAAGFNVYQLLRLLQNRVSFESASSVFAPAVHDLSPIEQEILRLLTVSQQSLRRSDILALCLGSPLVLVDHEYEIDEALHRLRSWRITTSADLPDGDELISLTGYLRRSRHEVGLAPADLVAAERLYTYFVRVSRDSERHSHAESAPLLYRLSRTVDPDNTPILIQRILSLSLQMGSLEAAERFIAKVTLGDDEPLHNYDDFLVRVVFHLSTRSYQRALTLLETPHTPEWSQFRVIAILRAIALNRTRQLAVADSLLDELLSTARLPEEATLLAAYKIAGRLHMNDVNGATRVFRAFRPRLGSAANFGYFLRNASSALPAIEAKELLSEALDLFKRRHDRFGHATTLANRAVQDLALGRADLALRDAQSAYDSLELFGIHHLHIITTNLGVIWFGLGRYDEAEKLFWRALSISRTRMPMIFQRINLAAVYALTGRVEESLGLLRDLRGEVERHPVDRVRQRYYVNAAAIGALCGAERHEINAYCTQALRYPDRKSTASTRRRISDIETVLASGERFSEGVFKSVFFPCSLAYWYQNPIEALPTETLTSKAVI